MLQLRLSMHTLLLASLSVFSNYPLAFEDQRIANVPMYGQPSIPRPESLKKVDQAFIRLAAEEFGTREAASKVWFSQAEEYMRNRELDLAMRRYNQSWLLNPNNYQPYWGFGRVMLERGKIDEAITHLETAKQLVNNPYQKVAVLVDLASAYSAKAANDARDQAEDKARWFGLANQHFAESLSLDPNYGNGWRRWAMSLFEEGDYASAWEKVKEARTQNARPLPPAFLQALEQKMPEPR